jgi:hypothetical protein
MNRWKDEHNAQHISNAEVKYWWMRRKDDHNAQHTSTTEVIYRRMRWKDDYNALCLCVCGLFLDAVSTWKMTWRSFGRKRLCYVLESPGFKSRQEQEIFLFSKLSRLALGATPLSVQKVLGFYVVGVKHRGRESCHSLPSSAEVKNEWSCTSTPTIWYSWSAQAQFYLSKEAFAA